MKLSDGSIINSNLGSEPCSPSVQNEFFNVTKIYVGQIQDILYTDNNNNRSKRYVEYTVQVSEDGITTSLYRNCRALDSYGDMNNFNERVYQSVTDGSRGKKDDKEIYVYKNGAIVIVGFIGGSRNSPFILGSFQHPSIGLQKTTTEVPEFTQVGSSTSRDSRLEKLPTVISGSKEKDAENGGQRILGEFQGLRWNINKDGELTILYQGPKDAKGQLTSNETQPTTIKINKDGEIFFIDNLDQEIKISRKDKKILISSGNIDPDFIEIDRTKKNITLDMSNDEIHNIDHDRVVNIKNNQTESITGASTTSIRKNKRTKIGGSREDQVSKDHINNIGGSMLTTAGKNAKIKAPLVELTDSSTSTQDGVITGQSVDPFTGLMHIDYSTIVKAKK